MAGNRNRRILCVTPNASVDRTLVVPGFRGGQVWRATKAFTDCGGKGVNVARAARTLGHTPVCAGLLAGHSGRMAAELAEREGLTGAWTWIAGETRSCIIIVDPAGGEATVINEPGPVISAQDWERLADDVLREAAQVDAVCLCGSVPPGCPPGGPAGLIRRLAATGRPVWVDCSGATLREALDAGPTGLKVNAMEAGESLGTSIGTTAEAAATAESIRRRGVAMVAITLGREGAVLADRDGAWRAQPPGVAAVSAVGSGDAFLAGLVSGVLEGMPPPDSLCRAVAAGAANALQLRGGRLNPADVACLLPAVRLDHPVA